MVGRTQKEVKRKKIIGCYRLVFLDDTFADDIAAPELVDVLALGVEAVDGSLDSVLFL